MLTMLRPPKGSQSQTLYLEKLHFRNDGKVMGLSDKKTKQTTNNKTTTTITKQSNLIINRPTLKVCLQESPETEKESCT